MLLSTKIPGLSLIDLIELWDKIDWLGFDWSVDVPGITTPEQSAAPVIMVANTAGRPLVGTGDLEYTWTPGDDWQANKDCEKLVEEGHVLLPGVISPERMAAILSEVSAAPLSRWQPIFNHERPNPAGEGYGTVFIF